MKHISLGQRLRYSFENVLSTGTIAIIGLLAVFSSVVICVAAAVILIGGIGPAEDMTFGEALWQSFLHAIDAGTVAGDNGWGLRFVMFLVTLCEIFIVSILIGSITSGLEEKLSELRKGRSMVIETNHTLILGWSSKIHSIVAELVVANENQKRPRIVILAPKDKAEMEDEIHGRLTSTKNTKIICRTGSPLDLTNLEIVRPQEARSIIVLSPESEHADSDVIKTILALTGNPDRGGKKLHIVAEIREPSNVEVAKLIGKEEVTLVLPSDLIAKVTAQTCRQSGLSMVYTELLDFDGAEIYFASEPQLVGRTYKEALFGFDNSAVIGLRRKSGEILLNPEMGTEIEEGDQVIVIAMDDDTIVYTERKRPSSTLDGVETLADTARKERTLILGWNEKGPAIIRELDHYVGAGSDVHILAEVDLEPTYFEALQKQLVHQTVHFQHGRITDRATLEGLNLRDFHHVIVLCYRHVDVQQADAETLIALLHLRHLAEQLKKDFSIVSEMLDVKNRDLAQIAKADDFIVSDKLVSLMLSQLSENRELKNVFDRLFTADGSEIYLKPIEHYVPTGIDTDFYAAVENAAQRGETAIGYRKHSLSHDPAHAFGVCVNPIKSEPLRFDENNCLIVLAEK